MLLSDQDRQRIYSAVHEEIMTARIETAKLLKGDARESKIDAVVAAGQGRAAEAAIKAAGECGPYTLSDAEFGKFALDLSQKTGTHQEWLAVVQFGMQFLLERQALLIEIIAREAQREAERCAAKERPVNDFMRTIFQELGLRLEVVEV